jgi:hypothetical protein
MGHKHGRRARLIRVVENMGQCWAVVYSVMNLLVIALKPYGYYMYHHV